MKRILPILSFILLTALVMQGQDQRDLTTINNQRMLKLYPNPAISFIKFEFLKNYEKGYTLQVVNFIGRQVYEVKNVTPTTTLDLSPYNRGVYIYQLKDASGKIVESGKFQVAR